MSKPIITHRQCQSSNFDSTTEVREHRVGIQRRLEHRRELDTGDGAERPERSSMKPVRYLTHPALQFPVFDAVICVYGAARNVD